jgi:hypothetical protein
MGYTFQPVGSALATALLALVSVQTSDQKTSGNLELRLQPEAMDRGVPQEFSFLPVNHTDHDVRLPLPAIECSDSYNGEIRLHLVFTPLKGGPVGGGGCAADRMDWPPIMERVREWRIVHPGETLTLKARHGQLHYDGQQPGRYEFWATYSPPSILPSDQEKLHAAGIDFARESLTTNHLTFIRKR